MTWFQQAELVHCRTAMTAVAGIIVPGVCTELHLNFLALVMVTAFAYRFYRPRLMPVVVLQLLTKIGILPPLPIWVDAGKVWIESHPSFPLGMLLSRCIQILPHNMTSSTLTVRPCTCGHVNANVLLQNLAIVLYDCKANMACYGKRGIKLLLPATWDVFPLATVMGKTSTCYG